MSLYSVSKNASKRVDDIETTRDNLGYEPRTVYSVFASALSEIGELATEIMIAQHHSYKVEGKDGIVGEAIDAIMCLFDIIHKTNHNLTEKDLIYIMEVKSNKWINKVSTFKGE